MRPAVFQVKDVLEEDMGLIPAKKIERSVAGLLTLI